MIPTQDLAERLRPAAVEMTSPLSMEECLHRLHIGLIDHRKITGTVGASSAKLEVKRRRNDQGAEMQVELEPRGNGTAVRCVTRLPPMARLVLVAWAAILLMIFGSRILGAVPRLLDGAFSWAGVLDVLFPFLILAGVAVLLHLRVRRDRRLLAEFVTEAVKGQVRAAPIRPTQRPLIE